MPPRTKVSTAPSTMAELKATLWKAADKLRGSMDASQYKDVALGLIFLKYVSDAFDERREQLRAELSSDGFRDDQIEQLIEDFDSYVGAGVFYVPKSARIRLRPHCRRQRDVPRRAYFDRSRGCSRLNLHRLMRRLRHERHTLPP